MTGESYYMAIMPSDPELKRLAWRAHHRGTKDADMLIEAMLEEQDVDIMAWAHGTAEPPERFAGPMTNALKKLDYIQVAR